MPDYVITHLVFLFRSDVNECEFVQSGDSSRRNDPCQHKCENFPGFFKCSCKDGYQLRGNQCRGMKGNLIVSRAVVTLVSITGHDIRVFMVLKFDRKLNSNIPVKNYKNYN